MLLVITSPTGFGVALKSILKIKSPKLHRTPVKLLQYAVSAKMYGYPYRFNYLAKLTDHLQACTLWLSRLEGFILH